MDFRTVAEDIARGKAFGNRVTPSQNAKGAEGIELCGCRIEFRLGHFDSADDGPVLAISQLVESSSKLEDEFQGCDAVINLVGILTPGARIPAVPSRTGTGNACIAICSGWGWAGPWSGRYGVKKSRCWSSLPGQEPTYGKAQRFPWTTRIGSSPV